MKIVFLDAKTLGNPDLSEIQELGSVELYQTTARHQIVDRIFGARIIVTNKVIIDRETMEASPGLQLICVAATGVNNIDIEAAAELNIQVKNVVHYSTASVVQHTFALIFSLLNKIHFYDEYVKSLHGYCCSDIFSNFNWPIQEVCGKTFGIIGMGTIGQNVARVAEAFGANVVYYSASGNTFSDRYPKLSLIDLLKESDIISIHAPLTKKTKKLIGYKELLTMRPDALLINTGRGGIVVEEDLARILEEQGIGGAGVDVFEKEPLEAEHPFLQLSDSARLILTPHVAWASSEARRSLMKGIASNIKEFIQKP